MHALLFVFVSVMVSGALGLDLSCCVHPECKRLQLDNSVNSKCSKPPLKTKCGCLCDIAKTLDFDQLEIHCEVSGSNAPEECFHSDSMVTTRTGKQRIADIVGTDAEVLSMQTDGSLTFEPVMYWLHADPTQVANFLAVKTESGKALSLTGDHNIYVTPCDGPTNEVLKAAVQLEKGQCVVRTENGEMYADKITSINVVKKTGIFAPMTASTTVVVDDLVASCLVSAPDETLAKMLFSWMHALIPKNMLGSKEMMAPGSAITEVILSMLELNKIFF